MNKSLLASTGRHLAFGLNALAVRVTPILISNQGSLVPTAFLVVVSVGTEMAQDLCPFKCASNRLGKHFH